MTGYPGSKGGAGVCEQIISHMPRHEVYVEPFAGHGAVARKKRPARSTIVIDSDDDVVAWWVARGWESRGSGHAEDGEEVLHARNGEGAGHIAICDDGVLWLDRHRDVMTPAWLVYADPPYLRSTRSSQGKRLYRHEFETARQHTRLLRVLRSLPCHVMLSGYDSPLYRRMLGRWHRHDYGVGTRGRPRVETLWMNFDPTALELHDVRFVGHGWRERERIGRKRARWVRRFASMPPAERQVIAEALRLVAGGDGGHQ